MFDVNVEPIQRREIPQGEINPELPGSSGFSNEHDPFPQNTVCLRSSGRIWNTVDRLNL